jgi:hypothetical protein
MTGPISVSTILAGYPLRESSPATATWRRLEVIDDARVGRCPVRSHLHRRPAAAQRAGESIRAAGAFRRRVPAARCQYVDDLAVLVNCSVEGISLGRRP